MTANEGFRPQFVETVYISDFNGARKVKFDAKVAMNKNLDLVRKFFSGVAGKDGAPASILPNFRNGPKRVEKETRIRAAS